jgi:hypothetical protein
MNDGKIASGVENVRPLPLYSAQRPTPTMRNIANWRKTTMPLPTIATCASRRLREDSSRCTIS